MTMGVEVIRFGDERLNPLGATTRSRLYSALEECREKEGVTSVVLTGGANFSAGADLTEFDGVLAGDEMSLVDLVSYVEAYPKPIVAAIDGVALGGGLELALACHYRICTSRSKLGLPEVTVGLIPGAGGTQRLPRLVGIATSIDMILTGKPRSAANALQCGLVDAVSDTPDDLLDCAMAWAKWAALVQDPQRRLLQRSLKESNEEIHELCSQARRRLPPRNMGGESVHCALEAIEASKAPNGNMQREGELFYQALAKGEGQRHAFFAVRAAQKSDLPPPPPDCKLLQKAQPVGVIGAGTMGSAIALVLLQAGYTVYLVDSQELALLKGVAFLQRTVQSMVLKGRLSSVKAAELLQSLRPTQLMQDLKDCALVVEAVIENMAVKKQIFTALSQFTPPDALLLTNTSTLDVSQIASVLPPDRQGRCAGWHFFSPAHVMKLVEIVVASQTSSETVALLQKLTKTVLIGKIGVTVGNCDGFVGNRMLNPYTSECVLLLAEGDATVESVDTAILQFGMALGPFGMSDLAGNDIGYSIRKERGWVRDPKTNIAPNRKPGMRYTELGDDLVTELGRIGQKALKGWYDYDINVGKGRKPLPSVEVSNFVQRYIKDKSKRALSNDEIVERVLFPLVNEGFKILEEGIAKKPSDIDVVYLYGYGWPSWRGGPMFWADHDVGLPYLLTRLEEFHKMHPGSNYYQPSRLLETCVAMGVTVQEYYRQGHVKKRSKL